MAEHGQTRSPYGSRQDPADTPNTLVDPTAAQTGPPPAPPSDTGHSRPPSPCWPLEHLQLPRCNQGRTVSDAGLPVPASAAGASVGVVREGTPTDGAARRGRSGDRIVAGRRRSRCGVRSTAPAATAGTREMSRCPPDVSIGRVNGRREPRSGLLPRLPLWGGTEEASRCNRSDVRTRNSPHGFGLVATRMEPPVCCRRRGHVRP